jgi:vancomycin resistance protein YoaR
VIDLPLKEKTTDRRVVLLLAAGLLALLGALYVAGYVVTGDKVPHGTTVAGVEIGGLEPAAARTALERQLGPRAERPIPVSASDHRTRIRPERAGLAVDYDESVARAGGGRSWNPARMWDYFAGGDELDAVVRVDRSRLKATVDKVAAKVDAAPKDGGVVFRDGTAEPRQAEPGRRLDRRAAESAVVKAFLARSTEAVQLPVRDLSPEITDEEVRAAMDDFANPAMSAPVILVLDDKDVVLRPEMYSRALSLRKEDGSLVPHVDKARLMAAIKPSMETVSLTPEPATVRLVKGKPTVVPGKNGITFDRDEVAHRFLSLVVKPDGKRSMDVKTVVARPDFTTRDARKLRIVEPVSSFTTYFPHADYRNTNLGRAAELVNGTVLRPGETFSLNGTVGERTADNGFTEGYMISNGVYKEDFGGGVSQVATTLFNAAFFAGLEDVEHRAHSFYIDRYPVGREATVVWGALDLKFKNDTPYGVLIESWITPSTPSSSGEMHVRMWSTKYWDITAGVSDRYKITKEKTRHLRGKNCVPHDGYGGFDVDVYRYFRRHGSSDLVRKETMHTTYQPSDTVVCDKNPDA